MIDERKQEVEAHIGLMQLLNAFQVDPMPSMPKVEHCGET